MTVRKVKRLATEEAPGMSILGAGTAYPPVPAKEEAVKDDAAVEQVVASDPAMSEPLRNGFRKSAPEAVVEPPEAPAEEVAEVLPPPPAAITVPPAAPTEGVGEVRPTPPKDGVVPPAAVGEDAPPKQPKPAAPRPPAPKPAKPAAPQKSGLTERQKIRNSFG